MAKKSRTPPKHHPPSKKPPTVPTVATASANLSSLSTEPPLAPSSSFARSSGSRQDTGSASTSVLMNPETPLSTSGLNFSAQEVPVNISNSTSKNVTHRQGKEVLDALPLASPAPIVNQKPTWSSIADGSNKKMAKRGESFLLPSGEVCVKISNDVIKRNKHKWDDFIIAQFHGNAPPPGALHAITNGIWSPKLKNITVSKLTERAFLIKIPCPITRKRVLAQGMWHIEKQSMFVARWEPNLQPEIPELTSAPVWLDFRNVPPHFYSQEGLEHIAGLLGEPLFLHPSTANMTNLTVARVFTLIDPTKPLPEAVNVQFESGHTHRIDVSSPWLPPTCDHCKAVGHNIKRCPTAPITCVNCKSTTHLTEHCPRKPKPKSEKAGTSLAGKPEGNNQQNIVTHSVTMTEKFSSNMEGNIVIDIGLDKLQQKEGNLQEMEGPPHVPSPKVTGTPDSPSSDYESSEDISSDYPSEEEILPQLSGRSKKVINKRDKRVPKHQETSRGKRLGKNHN